MIPDPNSTDLLDSINEIEGCTTDDIRLQEECSRSCFVAGFHLCQTSAASLNSTCSLSSNPENSHGAGNKTFPFDGNNDGSTGSHSDLNELLEDYTDTSDTFHSMPHQRRSSSTETVKRITARPDKVHFAASPYLQAIPKGHTPSFRNPFSGEEEAQSRRASDTSQVSDIFLPERFAGHRDTLDLLLDDVNDADDDEEQDSFNNTPTQAGYLYHTRRTPLR